MKTLHTNNIVILPESSLGLHDHKNVRKAYPAPDTIGDSFSLPDDLATDIPPVDFIPPNYTSLPDLKEDPGPRQDLPVPSTSPAAPSEPVFPGYGSFPFPCIST